MKYIISFFITFNAFALPINIYFERGFTQTHLYQKHLVEEYQIPEELIMVKAITSCIGIKGEGRLDLCLQKNGDLIMVSIDRDFIIESLKVFRAP